MNSSRPWTVLHAFTVDLSVRFIRGQATALREKGIAFEVVSTDGPELPAITVREAVPTHAVTMLRQISPLQDLVALARLMRVVQRVRPNAVHAHTPKAGLLLTIAAMLLRVPVRIYHVHGVPWETATGVRRVLLTLAERIACACATHVVCVSHSVERTLIAHRLCTPGRTRVLAGGSSNGVDAEHFNRERVPVLAAREFRDRHGVAHDAPLVGFIGRVVRDKGLGELAEAWTQVRARVPNARLVLVGPEEPFDPLPESVRSALRNDASVVWHGTDWDTAKIYRALDLLVLPTYREGFPNVLLEAAAMSLPVVASAVNGCTDAVAHDKTGVLVPVHDAPALADSIIAYLLQPERRRAHGPAARTMVEARFSRQTVWSALGDFYAELRSAQPARQQLTQRMLKRSLDVLVSAAALLLLAPVMAAVAIAVRVKLGGPVLFRQQRPGLAGRAFTMVKFRTMLDATGADGKPLPDGDRLTSFGKLLRSTSLDELPELWNVLRGDMSLVGPRPLLMEYLERYTPEQARRHEVRPGVTGWAQVNGRNALSWEDRFRCDVWYVEHRSLSLDLRIIARTLALVVRRTGVNAAGESTMFPFRGTA